MMTPLEILANNPTPEEIAQVHAQMVTLSGTFAEFGDPLTWEGKKNLVTHALEDFAWKSGSSRALNVKMFDEWRTGQWNHVYGVIKPREIPND